MDYLYGMNNPYTALYHHGILGQKWGVRRYQNKDGSLTPEGKKRRQIMLERLKSTGIRTTVWLGSMAVTSSAIRRLKFTGVNRKVLAGAMVVNLGASFVNGVVKNYYDTKISELKKSG